MHVLERNKETIWFSNPSGIEMVVDDDGLKTGEKKTTYGTPVKARMSIAISSGANNLGSQGMAELDRYGITTGYTHRAVTEDLTCTMNEESIVWYRISPTREEIRTRTRTVTEIVNGEEVTHRVTEEVSTLVPNPHNFKVVRKAISLNHLIFYLKEVDVS